MLGLQCCHAQKELAIAKNGEKEVVYKYNGSLCGASFAIPQIAGLFLLARQVDKDITFKDFIKNVRDLNSVNRDGMTYLDANEIISNVKNQKNITPETITSDTSKIGLQEINSVVQETNQLQYQKATPDKEVSK